MTGEYFLLMKDLMTMETLVTEYEPDPETATKTDMIGSSDW